MGNCQAAEAATVVIEHPGSKIERIYWSVSARQVMNSNPGHYVALLIRSPTLKSENGTPLKHLKLLRPHDTLLIGHVYRLISFEEVLKEFAAKKCVRLGKLLKETGGFGLGVQMKHGDKDNGTNKVEQEHRRMGTDNGGSNSNNNNIKGSSRRHYGGGGQWRPALQSIAESGS